MPETPSAGEKLSPTGVMPPIPQTNVERRESSSPFTGTVITGHPAPASRSQRIFLKIELSPELDAALTEMAREEGEGGYIKMMRDAFGLLKIAQEARREGKRLVVIDDRENTEQEITL